MLIICWILTDHAMCLCSRRVMVSVLKLKFQPRIMFVSAQPPSTANLSFAIIGLWGMGLCLSLGHAANLIASGNAASSLMAFSVSRRSTFKTGGVIDVHASISTMVDGDVTINTHLITKRTSSGKYSRVGFFLLHRWMQLLVVPFATHW